MVSRGILLVAALAAPSAVSAQSRAEPECAKHTTTLGQVACELARGLPRDAVPTLVVPARTRSAVEARRLDELAARLAALLAGELGAHARAGVSSAGLADLSRVAEGRRVIALNIELERDRLAATADLLASLPRFWERLRGVTPGVRAHAFASRALDAELRTFFPPVPLVVTRIDKSAPLDEPSLALACGDADGDGNAEIVSVGRHRIQIGRLDRGRFVVTKALPWATLVEVAPRPLREPLASAAIRADGLFDVGLSDRAAAVRLDGRGAVAARFAGRIPWPGGDCATLGPTGLAPERSRCEASTSSQPTFNGAIDTVAGLRFARPDGSVREVYARRKQQDSLVELWWGEQWVSLPDPVGAQLALGDLDGDGHPELISSNDTRDPSLDFVLVQTLQLDSNAAPRELFRVPVPAGVHAISVCPLDASSLAPIVVATGEGLWVLR